MIILPAIMEGVTSRKDGTVRVSFGTNELLPSMAGDLFSMNNKCCYIAIKPTSFNNQEREAFEQLDDFEKEDGFKSKSQQMRAVLYRIYEADNNGFDTFTMFYEDRMERMITKLKEKI